MMSTKARGLMCRGERAKGKPPCANPARKGTMTCASHAEQEETLLAGVRSFFVYGTLKSGYGNNRLMAGCIEGAEPATVDGYTLYGGGIPFARPRAGEYVNGELNHIKRKDWPAVCARVDALEGHPRWYVRTLVWAVARDGMVFPAWMYVAPESVENERDWLGSAWPRVRTEPNPDDATELAREVEEAPEEFEEDAEQGELFEDEYTEEDGPEPDVDAPSEAEEEGVDVEDLAERWGCTPEDLDGLTMEELEDMERLADEQGL